MKSGIRYETGGIKMRGIIIALTVFGGISLLTQTEASALPGSVPSMDAVETSSPTEQARLYCYNRYTGRFLHWGACGGGGYYRRRPGRVYCYNRRSGRFLHWGAC
jgi:hypothetical protein